MDAVTDDAAARLARRYPPSRPQRWWIPAAVVLAAVGAVWLVWAGAYGATGTVTARVDAFEVRSDTVIDVTVTVDRPDPKVGAECLLYAQAVTFDRVGETRVNIAPGGTGLTTVRLELRTFKRATTAATESCRTTP
jgi:Domain of unknown function (DUF4307)